MKNFRAKASTPSFNDDNKLELAIVKMARDYLDELKKTFWDKSINENPSSRFNQKISFEHRHTNTSVNTYRNELFKELRCYTRLSYMFEQMFSENTIHELRLIERESEILKLEEKIPISN